MHNFLCAPQFFCATFEATDMKTIFNSVFPRRNYFYFISGRIIKQLVYIFNCCYNAWFQTLNSDTKTKKKKLYKKRFLLAKSICFSSLWNHKFLIRLTFGGMLYFKASAYALDHDNFHFHAQKCHFFSADKEDVIMRSAWQNRDAIMTSKTKKLSVVLVFIC